MEFISFATVSLLALEKLLVNANANANEFIGRLKCIRRLWPVQVSAHRIANSTSAPHSVNTSTNQKETNEHDAHVGRVEVAGDRSVSGAQCNALWAIKIIIKRLHLQMSSTRIFFEVIKIVFEPRCKTRSHSESRSAYYFIHYYWRSCLFTFFKYTRLLDA